MRQRCCKGCQGCILRSVKRFGRLGKRSWSDDPEELDIPTVVSHPHEMKVSAPCGFKAHRTHRTASACAFSFFLTLLLRAHTHARCTERKGRGPRCLTQQA